MNNLKWQFSTHGTNNDRNMSQMKTNLSCKSIQRVLKSASIWGFSEKTPNICSRKKHIYTVSFDVIVMYLTLRAVNKNLKFKYQSEIEVLILNASTVFSQSFVASHLMH